MDQRSRRDARRGRQSAQAAPRPERAATIIVPLDGTTHALAALPVAQVLAELQGAILHIVHVGQPILPPQELLNKLGLTPKQFHGMVLDQETGRPAAGIVAAAQEWQSLQIALCTHTGPAGPHATLGPIAEEVLNEAPCPVVLVRPERGIQPWALRRMLLPHDGTPISAVAIGPAADLAHLAGAALDVLHVGVPGAALSTEPGTMLGPRYLDQPQHEWPAWAHEFLDRFRGLGHVPTDMKLDLFLTMGEPGAEVVRFAREHESDLVVLGWRGHLEVERAATMKSVISDAPCPVLIVRVAG